MKKLLLTIITLLSLNNSYAQLPNGSVAPDWTLTDLNGTSHNLYTYLNNGYTVFIDFSAVWCPPCWSYHQSGALENLYIDHGPAGAPNVSPTTTDDVMVFFIEGDAGTLAQLNGGSGSQGDWVTGTPYPIIPTYAGSNSTQVTSDYQIGYWPTIYMVCPDKLITESGTSSNPYSLVSTCLPPATYNNDATFSYTGETVTCEGDLTPEIMIQNYGLLNLTSLSIEVKVNGTSQSVTPWVGNLATYAMDNVTLPTLIGLANNDLVTIEVSLPNGVADQDPSNNPTISFNTSLAIQNTNINVTVNITTDAYGSETTWDLKNSTGQTIASGGPYNDLSAAGTTTQTPVTTTLSGQECHTFTIYDSYGDGINAGYGAGFFTVVDGNGTTLVSGGVFTYEDKGSFKTGNTSTTTYVPDDNFENYLEANGMGDGIALNNLVLTSNINTVTYLNVNNENIADLTGIEDFTYLGDLRCDTNQLTSLDVSANTALMLLKCQNNQLTSLDVSANTALIALWCKSNQLTSLNINGATSLSTLHCNGNQLTSLDVNQNTALTTLNCQINQLTTFDVSQNIALTHLYCNHNNLTTLDVSNNTALTSLQCGSNPLTSLDVSQNTALNSLNCSSTPLTSLDVSQNTALTTLYCPYNSLTSLDVSNNTALTGLYCWSNQLTSLDVRNGNNTNFSFFQSGTNPNLFCIDVDNPSWSATNWTVGNGNIDAWASFSNNCATVIYGCTDSTAINYNPLATIDDSSCVYCNFAVIVTTTDVSCYGGNDGTATITPTGATGPYTYLWNTGQITQTATSLVPGNYSCTITDANGCSVNSGLIVVNQPTPIVITASNTPVSCNGGNTGTATVSVSGGTPGYIYNWNDGQTTATATGLISGTYSCAITDANGCSVNSVNIFITQPTPIVITTSNTLVSCYGGNDGTATIIPIAGTGPYTYLWSNGATTATISMLVAGTYVCTVTDANGCSVNSGPIVVTQPTAIISSLTATAITSTGANDGIITTLAPSGGTSPYTYSWVGPSGFTSTTQNLTNLAAGTYTVTITDAIGCTLVLQEVINVANCNVIITDTYIAPSCYGYSGSLTWINSGGVPPYDNYMYNPSTGVVIVNHVLYNSPNTPLLVPVGVYDLIVTDASNCQQILSLVVTAPDSIIVNVTASDASCFGSNDGIATVTPTGGTAPYTYLWNNGQTTATATGLIAGTYWWTTNDANFCTQTSGTIVVSQPSQIAVTTSTTLVSCYGACDGTASVNVSGGTAPYTYLWSPSGQTTPTIVGLCPSAYFVSVVDANGCTIFYPFVINEPNALIANVTTTNVSCFSANDGSIIATTSGGVPPYQYSLDGGLSQSNGTFTGLSPATYWVDITDANGCMIYQTVVITEPPALNITATVTNVSCFGMCDGSSSVSVTGGTPTYNYSWSNGQTAPTITNLCAGTYVCAVADVNNCITQSTVIVAEPAPLSISVDSADETSALNDGSATAFVLGGSWPYTYIWSNGGTTNPQVNLAPGLYTVTVTDANGCVISEATSVNAYNPTGVINIQNTKQTLLKITDMLGQETPYRRNTPLFYIYDDGTVEKRIVIE